ncbi:MAG: nuclear transport factor 2 family protein [Geodermatophilaceae bacterium]
MSRFGRIVVAFNEGRVEDVVASVTEDYSYSDPTSGRIEGSAGHVALMRQVLERFPDRRIEVLGSWRAEGAEFAEYRWTGTPAGGGQAVSMVFAAVIELDGGQMRRFANFQG